MGGSPATRVGTRFSGLDWGLSGAHYVTIGLVKRCAVHPLNDLCYRCAKAKFRRSTTTSVRIDHAICAIAPQIRVRPSGTALIPCVYQILKNRYGKTCTIRFTVSKCRKTIDAWYHSPISTRGIDACPTAWLTDPTLSRCRFPLLGSKSRSGPAVACSRADRRS